jgi:tyrosyl-tRNA synthetase
MTFALLTTSDGKKMGKTQNGAVWLDPEKMSPYDFYQYWRNVDDADVIKLLRMITFVPLDEIAAMEQFKGSELNKAKERLAFEVTRLVHGEEEAGKAREATRALFGQGGDSENMPSTVITQDDLADGSITILDLLVKSGLTASKSDARRLIEQGGILVNDFKIASASADFGAGDFEKMFIIKKGKKVFHKITLI